MKISLPNFESALIDYVNKEMVVKLSDWRKWGLPVAAGYAIPIVDDYFNKYKDMLRKTELVDDSDMIDIESLYDKFHKVAVENGDIIQSLPIFGEVKFSARDIESLYRILQNYGGQSSFYDKGNRI